MVDMEAIDVLLKGAQVYMGGDETQEDNDEDENENEELQDEPGGMGLTLNDFNTLQHLATLSTAQLDMHLSSAVVTTLARLAEAMAMARRKDLVVGSRDGMVWIGMGLMLMVQKPIYLTAKWYPVP